jgi:hypothetical protein
LQYRRLSGEWEVTGIPDTERALRFIRDAIPHYSKNDPEAIREIEWAEGTMKIVYDPAKHNVEQVEFMVNNSIYRSSVYRQE